MSIYYVYAYLRQRADQFGQTGTPCFIGSGIDCRITAKLAKLPIPEIGRKIIPLATNLAMQEAQQYKDFLIEYFGCIDNGTGCLYNEVDDRTGGDDTACADSLEFKKKNLELARISVAGGAARLYVRRDSRYYWVKFAHAGRQIRATTRSSDIEDAKIVAEKWFIKQQAQLKRGIR